MRGQDIRALPFVTEILCQLTWRKPIWILYWDPCGMGFHVHPGNFTFKKTCKKMEKVFLSKHGNPAIKFQQNKNQRKGSTLQSRTWGKIQKSKGKTVRPTKKTKTKGKEETRGKIPKEQRARPFKSQEATGWSRMTCWSSCLDVLDFNKKTEDSEALNWGDYQTSRWTGVTFVEEAGLKHLIMISHCYEVSYQSMSSRNLCSFRSLSRRTHTIRSADWSGIRFLFPTFQANLYSSWDTHRAVKQGWQRWEP